MVRPPGQTVLAMLQIVLINAHTMHIPLKSERPSLPLKALHESFPSQVHIAGISSCPCLSGTYIMGVN